MYVFVVVVVVVLVCLFFQDTRVTKWDKGRQIEKKKQHTKSE